MLEENYLSSAKNQFSQYRNLGERAIAQIPDEKIDWQYNPESNSIATIVKHMAGNMLSRFTDFLTSDGEKTWRNRDAEFENEQLSREKLMTLWNDGWARLSDALQKLTGEDLSKKITIRNEEHTVMEAINRQLTHYAYHTGQIVFIGKMICDDQWQTLTISKGNSRMFNAKKGIL